MWLKNVVVLVGAEDAVTVFVCSLKSFSKLNFGLTYHKVTQTIIIFARKIFLVQDSVVSKNFVGICYLRLFRENCLCKVSGFFLFFYLFFWRLHFRVLGGNLGSFWAWKCKLGLNFSYKCLKIVLCRYLAFNYLLYIRNYGGKKRYFCLSLTNNFMIVCIPVLKALCRSSRPRPCGVAGWPWLRGEPSLLHSNTRSHCSN